MVSSQVEEIEWRGMMGYFVYAIAIALSFYACTKAIEQPSWVIGLVKLVGINVIGFSVYLILKRIFLRLTARR